MYTTLQPTDVQPYIGLAVRKLKKKIQQVKCTFKITRYRFKGLGGVHDNWCLLVPGQNKVYFIVLFLNLATYTPARKMLNNKMRAAQQGFQKLTCICLKSLKFSLLNFKKLIFHSKMTYSIILNIFCISDKEVIYSRVMLLTTPTYNLHFA